MKPVLLLLTIVASLTLFSCQKEIDWNLVNNPTTPGGGSGPQANPNGVTGGTNGTVLLRAVRKNNLDSVVALFDYNSADKFIKYVCLGKEKYDTFDITYNIYKTFERDASGRIVKFVTANTLDTSLFGALDSIRSTVHYPSASSVEFDYVVTKADMGIANMVDSTLYTFSGGRVASSVTYSSNDFIPGPPTLARKVEYFYDVAGNVKELRSYYVDQATSQLKLANKTLYTFDDKPNVHYFKNDGIFIGDIYYGPNNCIKGVQTDVVNNQSNIVSLAYNYNAQNHPKNGQMAANNPNRNFTLIYYYR